MPVGKGRGGREGTSEAWRRDREADTSSFWWEPHVEGGGRVAREETTRGRVEGD